MDCIACEAPLSVGFPRQESWSGLPFPSPGSLPDIATVFESPALVDGFWTARRAHFIYSSVYIRVFQFIPSHPFLHYYCYYDVLPIFQIKGCVPKTVTWECQLLPKAGDWLQGALLPLKGLREQCPSPGSPRSWNPSAVSRTHWGPADVLSGCVSRGPGAGPTESRFQLNRPGGRGWGVWGWREAQGTPSCPRTTLGPAPQLTVKPVCWRWAEVKERTVLIAGTKQGLQKAGACETWTPG